MKFKVIASWSKLKRYSIPEGDIRYIKDKTFEAEMLKDATAYVTFTREDGSKGGWWVKRDFCEEILDKPANKGHNKGMRIYINTTTQEKLNAALKQLGFAQLQTAEEFGYQIGVLVDSYFAKSGAPKDSYGNPINIDDLKTVEFAYQKDGYNEKATWRTVQVAEQDSKYLKGFENGEFKCFLKERIVGGKIIEA